MGKTLVILTILSILLGGCGDDIQGNLRLLLAPIHDGRGQTQDPFVLVDRVELGLVDEWAVFHPLGNAAPKSRFGPGLVGGGRKGAPYVIGLNTRDRPVAQGFGPYLSLVEGIDTTLTLPFYELNTAVATRIPAQERTSEPFAGKAPAIFIDDRHKELGSINSGGDDLSAVITLLWQGNDLLIQIRVRDDQVTNAPSGGELTLGDAVRVYLEDQVVTVTPDGRIDGGAFDLSAGEVSGGYLISMVTPLSTVGKNRGVGFDVRIYDKDGEDPVAMATWQFDGGGVLGDELQPAEFGTLVLGVPLIDLLQSRDAFQAFPCQDGMVEVTGTWSESDLTLTITVPDDEVNTAGTMEEADRVEVYLDLVNNRPPSVDPARFVRIVTTAGGSEEITRGNDLASLTQNFTFTGVVQATASAGVYSIFITLPWEDLELVSSPQRGWFLGLEIRVMDEDAGGSGIYSWSDSAVLDSDLFPELRLFTVE